MIKFTDFTRKEIACAFFGVIDGTCVAYSFIRFIDELGDSINPAISDFCHIALKTYKTSQSLMILRFAFIISEDPSPSYINIVWSDYLGFRLLDAVEDMRRLLING